MDIEERQDPTSGATYFFNTTTQKSGWTREEVTEAKAEPIAAVPAPAAEPAAPAVAEPAAVAVPVATASSGDPIEERQDPNTGATYFFNTTTQKSGWTREEVVEAGGAGPAEALPAAGGAGPAVEAGPEVVEVAPAADEIEERKDPNTGATYFFNTTTQKSGWTREEVTEAKAEPAGAEPAGATPTAADGPKTFHIEEKFDETYKRNFYTNTANGKTGWTREEVLDDAASPGAPVAEVAVEAAPAVEAKTFTHTFPAGALGMSIGIKGDKVIVNEISSKFGAAASKGVEAGDVVTSINGKTYAGLASVDPLELKQELKIRPLRLTLLRDGAAGPVSPTAPNIVSHGTAATPGTPAAKKTPATPKPSTIEERLDPSSGVPYFFDTATQQSAWTREELEPAVPENDDDDDDDDDDDEVGEMDGSSAEAQARDRGLSVMSVKAIGALDGIEPKLAKLEADVTEIEAVMQGKGRTQCQYREQVAQYQGDIAQINGLLEKLQFTSVDAVGTAELNSGKDQARTQRKALNGRCETLRQKLMDVKPIIDAKKGTLPPDPTTAEFKSSLMVEGWLLKKGHQRTNWHKRWFIMDLHTATLSYYAAKPKGKKQKKGKVKGDIKLDRASKFETPKYKKDKYDNFFTLSNKDHKMEMRAADKAGMDAWKKTCEYCISTMAA
jgi:spore germination cell wall hydrolase CwlJ-like protein